MSFNEMPIEFKHMARQVGGDISDLVNSIDDLVALALNGFDYRQAATVRPFLRALLAQQMPPESMAEFWSSTPSGIYISDGESVRLFLTALLERIDRAPYLTGGIT